MRKLASYYHHISNGGLEITIMEDEGCIDVQTGFSYCEHSHTSSMFCGSDIGPDELEIISKLFMDAARELRDVLSKSKHEND